MDDGSDMPITSPTMGDIIASRFGRREMMKGLLAATAITAVTPAGAAGTVNVAVTTAATPKLATPPKKTAAAGTKNKLAKANWGVQIGAFKSKKEAQKMLTHVRNNYRDLKNTSTVVSSVKTKQGRMYRAKLIGLTENRAQSACSALKNRGRSCTPVRGNG
jgi:cell division septation protein DedD